MPSCRQQRRRGAHRADERNRHAGLRVCHKHGHRAQENDAAEHKAALILDGVRRIRITFRCAGCAACRLQLMPVNQIKIEHNSNQRYRHDQTRVRNKIAERIPERCTDDDIRGIAAHCGCAAEICAENFGKNHRNRVKLEQLRQLHRNRCQKQNDRDAVDEHRQNGGHQHKGDENRNNLIMDKMGDCHAQPAEKADPRHAVYHNHHSGNKQNGCPVDAARFFRYRKALIPEAHRAETAEIERPQHRLCTAHAKPKNDHKHGTAAQQRDNMPLQLLCNNQCKHQQENNSRSNLCYHTLLLSPRADRLSGTSALLPPCSRRCRHIVAVLNKK